jgi:hypothetical protein
MSIWLCIIVQIGCKRILPSTIGAGNVDRTLALDVPDHLGDGIFRRNCDQHVHMVEQKAPFQDLAFLVPGQFAQVWPQFLAQPSGLEQLFLAVLRYPHDVVFAFPLRMG